MIGSAVRDQRLIAAGLLAATLQMIAHTAAKSLLFTASAGLEETAGSDDLEVLRGMGRRAPWSGTGLAIGSLTLAGLPPTAGFVSGFSILSPAWLWIEIPVLSMLAGLFAWAVSGRRLLRVRRVPAWRSATIGVQGPDSYTDFAYANPTRRVLANVLHTRSEVRVLAGDGGGQIDDAGGAPEAPGGPDDEPALGHEPRPAVPGPPHLGYRSDVVEVFETYGYRPAVRLVMAVVAVAKRLQSGRLDAYMLYMLIALIAVIAVVTAMA